MAIERRYIELELAAAIDGFAAARAASLTLLRGLPLQDWMRRAEFEARIIDLKTLIGMMVEHDRGHLLSIQGVFVTSAQRDRLEMDTEAEDAVRAELGSDVAGSSIRKDELVVDLDAVRRNY